MPDLDNKFDGVLVLVNAYGTIDVCLADIGLKGNKYTLTVEPHTNLLEPLTFMWIYHSQPESKLERPFLEVIIRGKKYRMVYAVLGERWAKDLLDISWW